MHDLLVFFHTPAKTGYAIAPLERTFFQVALQIVDDPGRIHFAYTSLAGADASALPEGVTNLLEFDPADPGAANRLRMQDYVRRHRIRFALGFDQSPQAPCLGAMRAAGVRRIVSYLGAPLSSPNSGPKLWLKRLEVWSRRHAPDHYIFESHAMARSGTHGRGISPKRVSVVHLGVDTVKFSPRVGRPGFLHSEFSIPRERPVLVYSGHMEERKGVRTLVQAAMELCDVRGRSDFHWLILGNREGQELRYRTLLEGSKAAGHVTFGGYSEHIALLLPECYAGTIASTGWDSFPRSAIEMASAGLPLLVSDLQGLPETIEENETGFKFPPGDHRGLANHVEALLDDRSLRDRLGRNARARVLEGFTIEGQVDRIAAVCREIFEL